MVVKLYWTERGVTFCREIINNKFFHPIDPRPRAFSQYFFWSKEAADPTISAARIETFQDWRSRTSNWEPPVCQEDYEKLSCPPFRSRWCKRCKQFEQQCKRCSNCSMLQFFYSWRLERCQLSWRLIPSITSQGCTKMSDSSERASLLHFQTHEDSDVENLPSHFACSLCWEGMDISELWISE